MKDIAIISIIVLIIDYVYLSNIAAKPFMDMVEKIQNEKSIVKYSSAAFTYALLILAIYKFTPNLNYLDTFILGFIIYGVFDFTNMALFNKYDLKIAIQDTVWGGVLFVLTKFVYNNITKLQ